MYSSLVLSLLCLSTASQQYVVLGNMSTWSSELEAVFDNLKSRSDGDEDSKSRAWYRYVWQLPSLLLNISTTLFVLSIFIMIWDLGTGESGWNGNKKVSTRAHKAV